MRHLSISLCIFFYVQTVSALVAAPLLYPAAQAVRNEEGTALVQRADFTEGQGVALKPEFEQDDLSVEREPDLVFRVQAPKEGRYWIVTTAGVDSIGEDKMQKAKGKFDSLLIRIRIDEEQPVNRVVFVPWHNLKTKYSERSGKFQFSGKPQTIRIWLQKGVQLDAVELRPYVPPKVPPAAESYNPKVLPSEKRPRLWVNAESLPIVRARLTKGENGPVWQNYRTYAKKPYKFDFRPGVEAKYDSELEKAAIAKAFVYLTDGDTDLGREAVKLVRDYFSVVSFGNYLDITREIGRAIYCGSLVYDWCYDLMSEEDRLAIRKALLRLAEDMEMGWPPFIGGIVNGHGNEMQMSRDLLSMGIALYGDDPVPYRYCSYRVLEELRPMLAYQYRSPRHHQGISYGPFRFECDMTAAWFLYRMSGEKVFHENIENVPLSWVYMRLPDGSVLPDGDGTYNPAYRRYANLLNFTYSGNPVLKGEYLRQYKPATDPLRWLLLNDPDLKPEPDLNVLPRTIDFGPILGGMVARTGWSQDPNSGEIVVEMKGGGKHFANHQHSDAGAFQIYFHEYLVGDLGIYKFYGTPYDMNFNKRSVSHSMMLVHDPEEVFGGPTRRANIGNDGGARLHLRTPQTPKQSQTEAQHQNGTRLASAFGPDPMRPEFSFFSVDLGSAYSAKIKDYVRSFCFLRDATEKVPGVLLVYDHVSVSNPAHKKYWQINSLKKPVQTDGGIRIPAGKKEQKGFLELSMLLPKPADRTVEILSDSEQVHRVFGVQYQPPATTVQTQGARTLFSPGKAREQDEFLVAMQMVEGSWENRSPVSVKEQERMHLVTLGRYLVGFARTKDALDHELTLRLPHDRESRVLLTGLAAGKWSVGRGRQMREHTVVDGNSTLYFEAKGTCTVRPVSAK